MKTSIKKRFEDFKKNASNYKAKDLFFAGTLLMIVLCGLALCEYAVGETIVEAKFQYEPDKSVFGPNPVGTINIKQMFFENFFIEYEHHSNVRMENDPNVYDAVGVGMQAVFFKKGCLK